MIAPWTPEHDEHLFDLMQRYERVPRRTEVVAAIMTHTFGHPRTAWRVTQRWAHLMSVLDAELVQVQARVRMADWHARRRIEPQMLYTGHGPSVEAQRAGSNNGSITCQERTGPGTRVGARTAPYPTSCEA